MTKLTTDRAVKKAYFTDLAGGNLVEFQFAPSSVDFKEGGLYVDRIATGNYFNDIAWISGKPAKFKVRMFIDRTIESFTATDYNTDVFSDLTRFPNENPRFSSFDVLNLIDGIIHSNTSSGFASSFKRQNTEGANEVEPSKYSASPDFKQNELNEASGVIPDLERLMHFVRPEGMRLSEMTIQTDGRVSTFDTPQGRFTPPPKCRFYFGNIWREGYITDVDYNLSVVNKQLVARRLDSEITMACTRWGYLSDIEGVEANRAIDIDSFPTSGNNGLLA